MLTSMDSLNYITIPFYDFWLLLFVCVLCTSFNNTKYYRQVAGFAVAWAE